MDKDTLISYIKSNFPKVIFNPVKLNNKSRSIGFIISDNKLIIGYINKDGNLCKLFEPIDLNNLSNQEFLNVLNRIPIVSGFDETNKTSLVNLLQGTTVKQNSREEHEMIIKELENSKSKYNILVDSDEKQIILIKKKYESTINNIKDEYLSQISILKKKLNEREVIKERCKLKLLNEKDEIIIGIKTYKQKVSDYISSIIKSRDFDLNSYKKLEEMYNKLLSEKQYVENNLNTLTINNDSERLRLTNVINEMSIELDSIKSEFKKSKIENDIFVEFSKNCISFILNEKEEIINSIKDYNTKWLNWVDNNKYNIEIEKEKLIYELGIIFTNFKKLVNTKNEYIDSLNLLDKEKTVLISKLNNNISDIKNEVKKSLNEKLIKLSLTNESINIKLSAEKDEIIKKLKEDLDNTKMLLNKNNENTFNPRIVDYTNCHATLEKFINVNNMFYRKKEIISILESILNNEENVNFTNLNENMKFNIKNKFNMVKNEINKHINFLDLPKYINSPNIQLFKSKSTLKNIPDNFCIELNNISEYWDNNVEIFTNQDLILTNIYEDLSGAVRVYIKIKPLLGIEQKHDNGKNTIYIEENTKKITVDCEKKETFGNFYGVFDESFSNENVYTGNHDINNTNENHDGLHSTFKQVEDGYSIVLFGYGFSGSGKCHGINTEIIMFDGSIKKVQDIIVGDYLMGDDSRSRKVLSLGRGRDIMYEVSNVKGEKYIVNSEHILSLKYTAKKILRDRPERHSYIVLWFNKEKICSNTKTFSYSNKVKEEVYKEANNFFNNLIDDLYVDIPLKKYLLLTKHYQDFLLGYKVGITFQEKIVDIDPYMIGYFVGDVALSEITKHESSVIKYFKDNLEQISENDDSKEYECNIFLNALKKYNLLNNKHIPMDYKCNSRNNQLKLLAGILDADGSYDNKKKVYQFSQSIEHENIIDDVIYMCRSLGFGCYKNIKKTSLAYKGEKKIGEAWIICISGKGIVEIPCLKLKAHPRKQIQDVLVSRITVTELKEDDYYGFELDGNHHYLMSNFIVTHNTRLLLGEDNSLGLLSYGLSNLNDVKNIKVKYLFEQYIDKFNPTLNKIQGKIINLVREVPQLRKYSIDETKEFSKYIKDFVDLNDIIVNDINKLTKILEEYRTKKNRIKKTPNNKVSSRSNLYIVFEITFNSGKTGYITIVDTAGKESPKDIYNTFINVNKGRINLTTLLGPTGGIDLVEKYMKDEYKDNINYTPNNILEILKEGFYINECLNHMIYFFNKKNYRKTKISLQTTLDKYSESRYYINPTDEEQSIDFNNNCLMIPILKFLDTLSNKKSELNDYRPTKFCMIVCIRKEKNYCDQIFSSLKFAQQIKST